MVLDIQGENHTARAARALLISEGYVVDPGLGRFTFIIEEKPGALPIELDSIEGPLETHFLSHLRQLYGRVTIQSAGGNQRQDTIRVTVYTQMSGDQGRAVALAILRVCLDRLPKPVPKPLSPPRPPMWKRSAAALKRPIAAMLGVFGLLLLAAQVSGQTTQVTVVQNNKSAIVTAAGELQVDCTTGCGGGTSSAFGDPFPDSPPGVGRGTAVGFKDQFGSMAAGLLDASGNLKVAIPGSVKVTTGGVAVLDVNLGQVSGVGVSLGQKAMSASIPVVIANDQAAVPVSGTFFQATQPVSGTFWQATQPVSGTFWQATQPVSGTFWQATQPVSGTVTANAGTNLNTSALALDATLTNRTQKVQITDGTRDGTVKAASTLPLATDTAAVVTLRDAAAVTGTFWQATQPVSFTMPALVAGSAVIGHVINDASSAVIGHVIADTGSTTAVTGNVTVVQPTGTNLHAVLDTTSTTAVTQATAANLNATVTQLALTKGTQGATGVTTQDLKDAGRTALSFYANGVASGTTGTETIFTLTKASGTAATTTGTSFVVTSGKRFRISSITVASRGNVTAVAQITTFSLRVNAAGACIVSSTPIEFAGATATPATALAWDRLSLPIPDGYEILGDGTLTFCLTANAVFVTSAPTWFVNIIGYEY